MSCSPISISLPLNKLTFGNNKYLPPDIIHIISRQVILHNFSVWHKKQIEQRYYECKSLCSGKNINYLIWPTLGSYKQLNHICCSLQARLNLFSLWDQLLLNGRTPNEPTSNTPKMTIAWILQWKQSRNIN